MRTFDLPLLLSLGLLIVACRQGQAPSAQPTAAEVSTPVAAVAEPVAETTALPDGLLPNQRQPLDGVVSGGQPNEKQLRAAQVAGFKTVINLRQPSEGGLANEPQLVEELGMAYVSLPIAGAAGLTQENVVALAKILDEADKPALLHCGSGNRIGALLALKAFYLDGKAADEATEIGLDGGLTRLEGAVREILESAQEAPSGLPN